ncbi:MAG: OsmC family protein [Nitrospirae bacterium]|nr:OsmC family protein [Nitrospirota bacterium]
MSHEHAAEEQELKDGLKDYKQKISPENKATLTWDKDLIFVGRTQRGYEIDFDARVEWGCMPTESLMLSLAGCMGIDAMHFLKKMRARVASFKLDITGTRNPTPPQFYTAMHMKISIAGKNITPAKMDKVIALSQEKYCSVYHSLRKDMKVTVDYTIEDREPEPKPENAPVID